MPAARGAGFRLEGPGTPVPALLHGLWRARRVLFVLARKDFYARYRRTRLGLWWAVALPLVQAVVLAIVFSRVVHVSAAVRRADGHAISYAVFVYSAMTVWAFFSVSMPAAATAIVDNAGMATKIYFPRAIFPTVVVASGGYPLGIGIGVLLVFTLALQHSIGPQFLYVVPGALLALGITAALGLVLSALHVYFRDVRYLVQAVMSVLFYVSPVLYSAATAPAALRPVVVYGPVSGPIELFRAATVGADPQWLQSVAGGAGWLLVALVAGLWLNSRRDRVFVDLL